MNTASHTLSFALRPALRRGAMLVLVLLLVGVASPHAGWGQATPPIRPQGSSLEQAGSTFWIEIQVGSEQASVEDLFGVSFALSYDTSRVDVLDDEAGPFLGEDVVYSSNVDDQAGEVGIGVSQKGESEGADGTGVVVRVQIQIDSDVPEGDTLSFRLSDVSANDSDGNSVALDPGDRGVTVATAIPMQPGVEILTGEADGTPAPGDTIAVDVTAGTSALPVSDLFGTSFTLTYDSAHLTVLSDTAGAFLGENVVYSSNLDAGTGAVDVGVSRKAGAGGVDGQGSVARVRARVESDVAEGTTLPFGVTNAQAKNPADSSIALSTSDSVITVNSIPDSPKGLAGSASGQNVSLGWTAPSEPDLERYRVYRDTQPIDSSAGPSGYTPLDSTTADTTGIIDSTGTPGTTYYYRVTAVDSLGSESGFSKEVQAKPTAVPVATTDSVSSVTDSSAVLYGAVNPGGEATEIQFRYHPSGSPSQADTVLAAESPVAGTEDEVVSASVTGLPPGEDYTYQVLASNSVGSNTGGERSFRTGVEGPVALTGPASSIADSSTTLEATVDPGGDSTVVTFEYGLDLSYGTVVVADTVTGTDSVAVSVGIGELLPGTRYHYRAVASNSAGSATGADSTFETAAAPPLAITDSVRNIGDTTATLYGTVNPGGASAKVQFRYVPTSRSSEADTVLAAESPVAGTENTVVSVALTDLRSGTEYAYQVLAINSAGSDQGAERTFASGVFPPAARSDSARVRRGTSRVLDVLANDEAEGGLDSATVSVETGPAHGTATVNEDGTITYRHDGSSNLSDVFVYTVADEAGQRSDPTTVIIEGVDVRVVTPEAVRGTPLSVDVVVEGDFSPDGTLYVRKGGGENFQEIDLVEDAQEPLRLEGEVSDTLVTNRGVDYYVVLADGDATLTVPAGGQARARRQPRHLPVTFETLEVPVQVQPETYGMVTVSAIPEGGIRGALRDRYGDYDPADWRVLRWNAVEEDYREYPDLDSLRPGEGFWLITADGEGLTLGDGQTAPADTVRTLPLKAGWNQVGSPFGYAVPWDTIRAASGLDSSQVDGPVAYEAGTYQYRQSTLRPWQSAFVRVPSADTLRVPPVGRGTGDSPTGQVLARTGTSAAEVKQSAESAYTLRLTARSGDERSQQVWLGLRPGAKQGRDTFDFAQAPPIEQTVQLAVHEKVGGQVVSHAGSFKPPVGKGQAWTLRLQNRADEGEEVRLGAESAGRIPAGQKRYVFDLKKERRVTVGQTLTVEAGETRRLKVIVGTKAYAEDKSKGIGLNSFENELRGNSPNPFDRATQIGYTLGTKQEVTLEVYNVLGQRVRTLVREEAREAGLHQLRWEGENRYGEPVGSGVYFLRLRAGQFEATRKMVLVR